MYNCTEGVWWLWYIESDIWFQDDIWEAYSLAFHRSFSRTWFLEEVLASIPWQIASSEMVSGFYPARFVVLFCSVVLGCRYTPETTGPCSHWCPFSLRVSVERSCCRCIRKCGTGDFQEVTMFFLWPKLLDPFLSTTVFLFLFFLSIGNGIVRLGSLDWWGVDHSLLALHCRPLSMIMIIIMYVCIVS